MPRVWSASPDRITCALPGPNKCGCDLHYVAVPRTYLEEGVTLRELIQEMSTVADKWNGECPINGR